MWRSFLTTSCAAVLLWGAGACFVRAALPRIFSGGSGRAHAAALPLAAGLLLNYLLVFFLGFRPLLFVISAFSAAGWGLAAFDLAKARPSFRPGRLLLPAAVALVFLVSHARNLARPIESWDARSIWFFHAKIILAEDGALLSNSSFKDPAVHFSHPDYPELVPALAAQMMAWLGFWNEFMPKSAVSLLLLSALLFLAAVSRSPAEFLWLAMLSSLGLAGHLNNGYMDGPLALLCLPAAVYAASLKEKKERFPAAAALLLIGGLMLGLKNDGLLWLASMAAALPLCLKLRGERLQPPGHPYRAALRLAPLAAVSLAGFALWKYYCGANGLSNYMFSSPLVSNGVKRLSSDRFALFRIFRGAVLDTGLIYPLAASLIARWKFRRILVAGFRTDLLLTCSCVHAALLFVVYLTTPKDLAWHLETSASRTVLPARLMAVAAVYYLVVDFLARGASREDEIVLGNLACPP